MSKPDALECVAFMLVRDRCLLVEKRSITKAVAPGVIAIPGGHLDTDESAEEGLRRELLEELGLEPLALDFICSLVHRSEETRRLHYYAVEAWSGEIENNEADELLWIALDEISVLDLDVDRTAVSEYLRFRR